MKRKIIAAFALLSTVLAMNSCADFLDVQPEGYPSQSGFFKTDKDATDAMDGVYRIFGLGDPMWGRNFIWEQACGDDIVFTQSRWSSLETLNFTGDESPIREAWSYLYEYMANAQWIIQSLLQKGEDNLSAVEKRTLGEAYFMRAFLHFHIAYRHGTDKLGVPYEPWESFEGGWNNQIYKQQESVVKNYEMIVSDLEKAAERLPLFETYGADNQGRAHKAAAYALMVKVWAYWAYWDSSKWALIPPMVDKLESECGRDLLPDSADPFKIANNYSSEYIWSVTSVGGATPGGSEFPGICLRNKAWGFYNGWGSIKPTHDIYEEYVKNPADKRLKHNIIGYQPEINTFTFFGDAAHRYSENGDKCLSGYSIAKWMEPYSYGEKKYKDNGDVDTQATAESNPYISVNGDWPTTNLNVPLIRHAEMVLFKAEALIQQGKGGDAAKELNRLAARAGLGDNFYASATMEDLKHERRCELAFEFTDRFMDLKRWGETEILSRKTRGNVPDKTGESDGVVCTVKEIWPMGENTRTWTPKCIVFPYPPQEIVKAGGAWRQPDGY